MWWRHSRPERAIHPWATGIVPMRTDRVWLHIQCLHHGVGDLLAGLIEAIEPLCSDLQARRGGRVTQIAEHGVEGAQGLAGPVETNLAEQAMLNRMPLRAASRVMTDGHHQPESVAELALELGFPQARTISVTAPRIGQDHELRGVRVGHTPALLPPLRNRRDGKLRCIGRRADIDRPRVAPRVIDAIRHSPAEGVSQAIMHVDLFRLLAPRLASILKVAKQCLLLGIDADDRPPSRCPGRFLRLNVLELGIAVRMLRPRFLLLGIDAQGIVVLFQTGLRAGHAPCVPGAPGAAAAAANYCGPTSAWSSDPPPFRASRSPAGPFPAVDPFFLPVGARPQACAPDQWGARRAPRPVPVVLAESCADPARSFAQPVGHPRARGGWTPRRHTTAAAVHPSVTTASSCGSAALDQDARRPAGNADIGTGELRH